MISLFFSHVSLIEEALRKGISDADSEARAAVRRAYWHFADHYKAKAERFVSISWYKWQSILLTTVIAEMFWSWIVYYYCVFPIVGSVDIKFQAYNRWTLCTYFCHMIKILTNSCSSFWLFVWNKCKMKFSLLKISTYERFNKEIVQCVSKPNIFVLT